ncbi:hypothetical protein DPMN_023224 [Dreissena polymorpha]|uniref:Uncharacterized protein n=1 Tax=Dreissena polymorpha TaxID=45954 RepID=A0A9D4R9Q3_DREPO|nr:hypothetical protein DPMN_023224 [Dreissena polymorpha]
MVLLYERGLATSTFRRTILRLLEVRTYDVQHMSQAAGRVASASMKCDVCEGNDSDF